MCLVVMLDTDGGRGSSKGYIPSISRSPYALSMRFSRLSGGPKLLFLILRAYSSAGTVQGDPYVYRKSDTAAWLVGVSAVGFPDPATLAVVVRSDQTYVSWREKELLATA